MNKTNNQSNPNATDVKEIYFRKGGVGYTINVFNTSREEAIKIYEAIEQCKEVSFACAFVENGHRI